MATAPVISFSAARQARRRQWDEEDEQRFRFGSAVPSVIGRFLSLKADFPDELIRLQTKAAQLENSVFDEKRNLLFALPFLLREAPSSILTYLDEPPEMATMSDVATGLAQLLRFVRYLVSRGNVLSATNTFGQTPVEFASNFLHVEPVSLWALSTLTDAQQAQGEGLRLAQLREAACTSMMQLFGAPLRAAADESLRLFTAMSPDLCHPKGQGMALELQRQKGQGHGDPLGWTWHHEEGLILRMFCASADEQQELAKEVVATKGLLTRLARRRYGHEAAKLALRSLDDAGLVEARRQLYAEEKRLRSFRYGRSVLSCLDALTTGKK